MKKSIEVDAYTDSNGNPTCAIDFPSGKVCKFYRTQRFGCNETCVFAKDINGGYMQTMDRRNDGNGSLIPLENCPLWNE